MTVSELIQKLKKCKPDAIVEIAAGSYYDISEVTRDYQRCNVSVEGVYDLENGTVVLEPDEPLSPGEF